jgi:hypothetical protein
MTEKHDRMIFDAMKRPTPSTLRIVCGWCQTVLVEGDPNGPTSHGMCPSCAATFGARIPAVMGATAGWLR